jgi:hypothetical protein
MLPVAITPSAPPVVAAPAPVQRQAAPEPAPAPAAVPGPVPADPAASQPAGPPAAAEPEELLKSLFDPLLRRLKVELRLDRERRGTVADLPYQT